MLPFVYSTDRPGVPMETLSRTLKQVVRKLLRAPLFTLVAAATLGIGIGANTAIFSLVHGVLLTPLPFPESDRLVGVWHTAPGLNFDEVNQSPALHFTYLDEGRTFEEIGIWDNQRVSITGLEQPEEVMAIVVTEGTFPALRVQPFLGRRFSAEDVAPGSPETVILSYGFWRSHFAGNTNVLGQTLRVDGITREIIGVMPEDLQFLDYGPALYLPLQFDRAALFVGNFSYRGLARLKPGVTLEEANADVARMIPLAPQLFPGGVTLQMLEDARFAPNLRPLIVDAVGDIGEVLWVLLATVGIVLLIACANVANLFLVRAEGREREVAVRTAMGASRRQVAWEFLNESIVLGLFAGIAGIGLAWGGLRFLRSMGPSSIPRLDEVTLNGPVLLFTLAISLGAGLLFGLFPILRQGRINLASALKEGGRSGSSGRERHRARRALVVGQMALALMLLMGSGLMIRSFQALRSVGPGFGEPGDVLTVRASIPSAEVEDPVETAQAQQLIHRRLEEVPGVTGVGVGTSVPMDGWNSGDPVYVEEFPVPEGQLPPLRVLEWVGEGYFETLQIPLLAGRTLNWGDANELGRVVVVSESFAREYWDTPADALGRRVGTGLSAGQWREIVGVVGDVHKFGVDQDPPVQVYWPALVEGLWEELTGERIMAQRSMVFAIRSQRVGSSEFLREVREAIWSVNANLPLGSVRTMAELTQRSMGRTSFTLAMLGIAAAVAMLLGAIGIYGVVAYSVSQRTREIGVRMAMGAMRGEVARMVLRQGMAMAAAGIAVGLAGSIGLTRLMEALLFGVSATDPLTFVAVSVGLAAVALLATYLPARKAARIDPVEALRYE
jgi:predicted permease